MGLLNKIVSTAVVIAVGTTLLPAVVSQIRHQAEPERRMAQTEDMGRLRRERQTYKEYVEERLAVERLMR